MKYKKDSEIDELVRYLLELRKDFNKFFSSKKKNGFETKHFSFMHDKNLEKLENLIQINEENVRRKLGNRLDHIIEYFNNSDKKRTKRDLDMMYDEYKKVRYYYNKLGFENKRLDELKKGKGSMADYAYKLIEKPSKFRSFASKKTSDLGYKDEDFAYKPHYRAYRMRQFPKNIKKPVAITLASLLTAGALYFGASYFTNIKMQTPVEKEEQTISELVTSELKSIDVAEKEDIDALTEYSAIVEKGDSIWNITKDYLESKGIVLNEKDFVNAVNKICEYNGKVKLGEYRSSMDSSKNPGNLIIGQEIKIPKNLIEESDLETIAEEEAEIFIKPDEKAVQEYDPRIENIGDYNDWMDIVLDYLNDAESPKSYMAPVNYVSAYSTANAYAEMLKKALDGTKDTTLKQIYDEALRLDNDIINPRLINNYKTMIDEWEYGNFNDGTNIDYGSRADRFVEALERELDCQKTSFKTNDYDDSYIRNSFANILQEKINKYMN